MASKRTTFGLSDGSRLSASGVAKRAREQRVKALERLFEMFERNDAAAEVRRLKSEDHGF